MDGWFFSKRPNLWFRWAQSLPPPTPPLKCVPTHPRSPTSGWGHKKKKKFGFQGMTFEVAIVGLWNTDVNSHAKTKGQRSLPVYLLKESQKGDHWRPCLTPEIILQAVTCCEVWTGSWKGGRQVQTADVLTTTRRVQLGRCIDATHRFNCSQKDKRNAAKECSQRLHRKLWFTFLLLTFFTRLVLFYTPPYVLLLKLVKKPR